jgi:homoserine dehydrogenase
MSDLKVGLLGFGTVGAGAARILVENADLIQERIGRRLTLKRVVDLDIETPRGVDLPPEILSTRVEDVLDDPEIEVVIQLVGGIEPARTLALKAIERGKHVVTANKALLADAWEELFSAASEKGVEIYFEGSVGGGIPIIRALREGLAANRIQTIYGIINGTSNYILSRMTETGIDFSRALEEAQEQGYAEADPTLDVNGTDAAHKLCILSTLAFGSRVPLEAVFTEGVEKITPLDISFAADLGYRVKLLALAKESDGRLEVRVHPTMIPADQPLAAVGGAFNAIFIRGDAVGSTLLQGQGAGSMPTGSAVVGDVMSLAARLGPAGGLGPGYRVPFDTREDKAIKPIEEVVTSYYIRFAALDRPGVLSSVSGILGKNSISISSVIQQGRQESGPVPIVMRTHEASEKNVQVALEEISGLEVIAERPVLIRVEENY